MKKKIVFLMVFITFYCYSQQIVRLNEDITLYNESFEAIKILDKNTTLKVSLYEFEYHINDNYEYDYYAELEDNYRGFKVKARKLIPEKSEDVFDDDLITKPDDVYFIDEYFQGLKLQDINIIYKCYENVIKKTENDIAYRDWKECCSFYQENTYITNSQISFQNYFSGFFGEIKNIRKEKDMYELYLSYYYFFEYNQNRNISNINLQKEGKNTIFYLRIDGDYISLYCSDKKTLINTYIRTKKQTQIEFDKFLKKQSYIKTNITWPRHADGTCDYEDVKTVSTPTTNVVTNKTMTVSENLKLRSAEATTSEVITVMSAGTKVKILELGKAENIDGISSNWVKVEVQKGAKDRDGRAIRAGTVGWCYGGYLK